jgi:hypothetical protein
MLEAFVSMPLDIFSEARLLFPPSLSVFPVLTSLTPQISSHLTPLDLLNLSRSCRSFRRILLNRTSTPLWRASRRNVALPDLEDGSDEPAYASLMYDKFCMVRRLSFGSLELHAH